MAILQGLKPEKVFYYFEEICKIPHGSGNTKEISDYLVSFAKEYQLKYVQDESDNVVIYKDATPGYENAPVTILQGHCDMVAEKTPESTHDFNKDGLKLQVEGDYVTAENTTLGGDDGIAVAYMLAILADDTLKHPALECVITSDEEIGLLGAKAIDTSCLHGSYMINLDSEEEGSLLVSCAGGLTGTSTLPLTFQEFEGDRTEVVIDGLLGGHSGGEIDKNRANANKLMARFLFTLGKQVDFTIADITGGTKDNAITRKSEAVLVVNPEQKELVKEIAESLEKELRNEYRGTDGNISIRVENKGTVTMEAMSMASKEKVVFYLVNIPYGIEKMSGDIEGLVETSNNIGILHVENGCLVASSSVRSAKGSAKFFISDKIKYLTEFLGGEYTVMGDYPAWEFKKESKLQDLMVGVYEDMFHTRPDVRAIHAGLECGIFYDKLPGLDCVSFGPDMKDIHTTEEMLSISSTERMWNYLLKVLEEIH